MEDEKTRFLAAMAVANRFAKNYEQGIKAFVRLNTVQSEIFRGTALGDYLALLDDKVSEAVSLNGDAGWLSSRSEFTEEEFLESLIRRDRSGKRYPTLAQVPSFLLEAFEEQHDAASFRVLAGELREACWSAYSGMTEIREQMDDEPTGADLLASMEAWPGEVHESEQTIKETLALSENLHKGWLRCQAAGLALLCMANQFGDDDPDQDLAIELMG